MEENIDKLKETEEKYKNASRAAEEAYEYAESIVNTVREPLIVLDGKLRVVSANKSFYNSFKVTPKETVGHLIYNLGNRQWNIPELRKLLEKILPNNTTFDNYKVEHDFPNIGRRVMLLNARRIPRPPAKPKIILLAIEDITNKKATQEALEETEEKFRQFFENSNDAIFIADPLTRRLIDCNKKAEKLVGRSKAEILSMRADKLHPTDRIKEAMEGFKEQMEGKAKLVETEVLTKTGKRIYVEVNSSIVQIFREKYMVGIFRNITERKQAEEELIAEKNKIKTYLDSLVDGVTVTDKNANIIEANKTYVEMLGYKSPLDIIGKSFTNFVTEKEIPRLSKRFTETIKNKELFIKDFEVIDKRKDGSEFPTMVNMHVLWNEGGYAGCISVIRDITELKKAEEKMKESENKYRAIFEGGSDGIIVVDVLSKKTIFVNKQVENITGYMKNELTKFTFDKLTPQKNKKYMMQKFQEVIEGKISLASNVPIKRKDKKIVFCDFTAKIIQLKGRNALVCFFRDITESKKTEQELIESEQKYKLIFEEASDGILVADIKTRRFVFANPRICEIIGYSLKELLKLDVTGIHPKKDLPYVLDQFKKQAEGKIGIAKDIPVLRKDKKIVFCDVNSKNIDIKGRKCIVGFFRDITERKKAEEELKERENRYRTLVENLPQKVFLKDKNSVYLSCNDNYAKDLKIKPEEITGKTDFEFYPKKLAKKYRADDNRIMKSGKTDDIEERYVQDRQESWVHTIKTPIRDEKVNVVGILGIFWDITEQKKAQEELKVSEARYRSYIEATKQLGWTTDAKGLIIKDIPTWRAYTGQSFEKIKNWGWIKAIHPDDAKHTAEVWKKAVKTKSIYETEYRIRGKDGKYKWFLARGIPVLKEDGSIREWVGTCIDISERIKTEEEIKKARDELQLKVEELEKFNKLTIGRELKMVELKRRIKELEYELVKKKENKLI